MVKYPGLPIVVMVEREVREFSSNEALIKTGPRHIVFQRKLISPERKPRSQVSIALRDTHNPKSHEEILGAPQSASIMELTSVIGGLEGMGGSQEKQQELKRIRRGKAIKLLRERQGTDQYDFGQRIERSKYFVRKCEEGEAEITAGELQAMIDIFIIQRDENFEEKMSELRNRIEGKKDTALIDGIGGLITDLRVSAGISQEVFARQLGYANIGHMNKIEKDKHRIPAKRVRTALDIFPERRKEEYELITLLKRDQREIKIEEQTQHKEKLLREFTIETALKAIVEKDLGIAKEDLGKDMYIKGNSATKERLTKILTVLKAKGVSSDHSEMLFLETALSTFIDEGELPGQLLKRRTIISPPMKQLRSLIEESLIIHNKSLDKQRITLDEFSESIGKDGGYLSHALSGELLRPDTSLIINGLENYLDEEDPLLLKVKEAFQQQETDTRWLQTFLSFRSENVVGQMVKLLIFSEGLTVEDFARKSTITPQNLEKIIKGRNPLSYVLNNIIEASTLSPDSLCAQRLRLSLADVSPLPVRNLKKSSLGEDLAYVRCLKGETHAQMAKELGDAPLSSVFRWQYKGAHPNQLDPEVLTQWLDLGPNSILKKIFLTKLNKKEVTISEEELRSILEEKYLFAEHIASTRPYPLTENDQEIVNTVDNMIPTSKRARSRALFKEVINVILAGNGYTESFLDRWIMKPRKDGIISIPTDQKIAQIMQSLNYPIHHPLSRRVLDLASKVRG